MQSVNNNNKKLIKLSLKLKYLSFNNDINIFLHGLLELVGPTVSLNRVYFGNISSSSGNIFCGLSLSRIV